MAMLTLETRNAATASAIVVCAKCAARIEIDLGLLEQKLAREANQSLEEWHSQQSPKVLAEVQTLESKVSIDKRVASGDSKIVETIETAPITEHEACNGADGTEAFRSNVSLPTSSANGANGTAAKEVTEDSTFSGFEDKDANNPFNDSFASFEQCSSANDNLVADTAGNFSSAHSEAEPVHRNRGESFPVDLVCCSCSCTISIILTANLVASVAETAKFRQKQQDGDPEQGQSSNRECPFCGSREGPGGERVWVLPEDLAAQERQRREQQEASESIEDATKRPAKSYYEILEVPVDASPADIKRSFRRLAALHHPDRPGGSNFMFLKISEAYEVLSDRERRAAYNESGCKPCADFDTAKAMEQVFGGGEKGRWHEYIGTLTFIREVNSSLQSAGSDAGAAAGTGVVNSGAVAASSGNDKEEIRRERITTLAATLRFKLDAFALEGSVNRGVMAGSEKEAVQDSLERFAAANDQLMQDLLAEPHGKELCRLLGHIYCCAAQAHYAYPLRWSILLGLDRYFARLKLKGETVTSMIRLVRKAYAVKSAYGKIEAQETTDASMSDTTSPSNAAGSSDADPATGGSKNQREAEEAAAAAALDAMWEGVRLELLGVISEVCKSAVDDDIETAIKRSQLSHQQILSRRLLALHRLGSLLQNAELRE